MNTLHARIRCLATLVASLCACAIAPSQDKVDVTLVLARAELPECEPLWASYAVRNGKEHRLPLRMADPVFYFQRQVDAGWQDVTAGNFFNSRPRMHTVAPGATNWGTIRLTESVTQLTPGVYRTRVLVSPLPLRRPGEYLSDWVEFRVTPHQGNRALANADASTPEAKAWTVFTTGHVRFGWFDEKKLSAVGWRPSLALEEYRGFVRRWASADVSPGLAAELALDLLCVESLQAQAAKSAAGTADRDASAADAARVLKESAALETRIPEGAGAGGLHGAWWENRIALLSLVDASAAQAERARMLQKYPAREGVVSAAFK